MEQCINKKEQIQVNARNINSNSRHSRFGFVFSTMHIAYDTCVSGISIWHYDNRTTKKKWTVNLVSNRLNIVLNTVFFVLGFSVVFSVFGVVLNSVLATSATNLISGFNQIGVAIIIRFGAFMLLSTNIHVLNFEIYTFTFG